MRVAVVGAGPAGCLFAWRLAGSGGRAVIFDASHPREKPCGGGLTGKALDLLPPASPSDPLPARLVTSCRFESGDGEAVDLQLASPVAVASRSELDAWLLRQALLAGAQHVVERVVAVEASGKLRTATGREERFDLVVGADGAGSLVRRSLLRPTPLPRLHIAAGWYVRGDAPMLVRFAPSLAGYLWLFPRRDHVAVGICAPLAARPTSELVARLEREVARDFPALAASGNGRYAHTLPCPSTDPASILEIGGPRWALLGDAAALADPITGEGIYYALRSAHVLADTLKSESSPRRYPERVLDEFGRELIKAASLNERFYAPGFARRMVSFSRRSLAVRRVLADLVLGRQGYLGLKRRLLRAGPRLLWDVARRRAA